MNPPLFHQLWAALSTLLAASATLGMTRLLAKPADSIELWSGIVPGEQKILPAEQDTTKSTDGLIAGKSVIRLGNVSRPTLQVFRPPADQDSGTAVLVFPGGGYHILAMDLEGTEICEGLNSIGVTGVLVKYRVPKRPGQAENLAPFQDAQRALAVVRWRAKEWGLNPQRLGVLGFSAGGHLAARLSNNYGERAYPTVDDGDRMSLSSGLFGLGLSRRIDRKGSWRRTAPGNVGDSRNGPDLYGNCTR